MRPKGLDQCPSGDLSTGRWWAALMPVWCLLTAGLLVESEHVGRPRQRGCE